MKAETIVDEQRDTTRPAGRPAPGRARLHGHLITAALVGALVVEATTAWAMWRVVAWTDSLTPADPERAAQVDHQVWSWMLRGLVVVGSAYLIVMGVAWLRGRGRR
jgi:hypothetical protein